VTTTVRSHYTTSTTKTTTTIFRFIRWCFLSGSSTHLDCTQWTVCWTLVWGRTGNDQGPQRRLHLSTGQFVVITVSTIIIVNWSVALSVMGIFKSNDLQITI